MKVLPFSKRSLEELARTSVSPESLLQVYRPMWLEATSSSSTQTSAGQVPTHQSKAQDTTDSASDTVLTFGCPWCHAQIKNRKDFLRHMKEKCDIDTTFKCTHCPKTYARKSRVLRHHDLLHPNCSRVSCARCVHVENTRSIRTAFGCGFCQHSSHDSRIFYNHLIEHYRSGSVLSAWDTDLQIHNLLTSTSRLGTRRESYALAFMSTQWSLVHYSAEQKHMIVSMLEKGNHDKDLCQILDSPAHPIAAEHSGSTHDTHDHSTTDPHKHAMTATSDSFRASDSCVADGASADYELDFGVAFEHPESGLALHEIERRDEHDLSAFAPPTFVDDSLFALMSPFNSPFDLEPSFHEDFADVEMGRV